MKKILISLAVVGVVSAIVIGGTVAYFSDTETSEGNTFTAGTIDIEIDGENEWIGSYNIGDLKPCETGYITFDITNVGQNPVNISKKISNWGEDPGITSEPECTDQNGSWDGSACDWASNQPDRNDIQSQIIYDLSVEVYADSENTLIWWQAIYTDNENMMLSQVYPDNNTYIDLGMIPVGGHMMVTQSYHFSCNAGNEYQGDVLSFDMEIKGEQMPQENGYASVVLENKTGPEDWDVIQDGIKGVLGYKTNGPEFEYTFMGKATLSNHNYVLAIGYDANTDVDTYITESMTDTNGDITFNGSIDLNQNMVDVKAWLVPTENWDSSGINWSTWPSCISDILWETGLINYNDTDN